MALTLLTCSAANATHIFGGDLLYQYISGTTYKITLTIYGDCAGSAFPTLTNANPVINIYRNGARFGNAITLKKEPGTGKEVTPVCPADSGSTACKNTAAIIPGIAQYIYSATVDIPDKATWKFVFDGNTSPGSAGRTNAIGNIFISGMGSLMYLDALLNNVPGPNSSPQYTNIPTPFYCVNVAEEYNQGAIDPNNDSLHFLLTPAMESSGTPANYVPPYSGSNPIAVTGTFTYNNYNGQMSFTPSLAQVSLVDNTIEEYKNGVLVGTSMREMTFIVLDNCNNKPPSVKIDTNVVGGAAAPGNTVNVCQGTEYVAFTVNPVDPDNNNITISSTGVPFGGNLSIRNNGTQHPVIEFNWTPADTQALGVYTFFLNYKDDGCPLSSNQTVAYTVRVLKPLAALHEVLFPTQCAHNAYVQFSVDGGSKPRIIDVMQNEKHVAAYSDSLKPEDSSAYIVADSFKKGTYNVLVYSPYLKCKTSFKMVINDSGVYPYPPVYDDINACLYDAVSPIYLHIDTTVFRLNWYDTGNTKLPTGPDYNTDTAGTQSWQISQTHLVCESEKVPFHVYVHPPPVAEVLTPAMTVCLGDEILLKVSGGATYAWLPESKVYNDKYNNFYTKVMEPTTYSAIAISEYGCKDTADVTFDKIEQCCTFSYPNAFTPNNDGKNDGFRALLYGNSSEYYLAVYNRWGQEVFHTSDPKQGWDGNFHGKACDAGIYFYRLKAKCLTGHTEERSGDLSLLR